MLQGYCFMFVADIKQELDSLKNDRIFQAFLISVMTHLVLFVFLEFAREYQLIEKAREIPLVRNLLGNPYKEIKSDIPLIFVEVNASQQSADAPEQAMYYSDMNSRAANPYPKDETQVQMDGIQEVVPRTFDQEEQAPSENEPQPLQPAPEETIETALDQSESPSLVQEAFNTIETKPEPDPSDLVMRPELTLDPARPTVPPKPRERPRTLAEAQARQEALSGATMNQLGGVPEPGERSTLDVKATGFGSYDRMFIMAVDNRWKQLLNDYQYSYSHSGKVVVDFRLKHDGSISHVRVHESTVSEVLAQICRRAIIDPSPYRPWPEDMKRVIGTRSREIRFTFSYH